MKKIVIDKPGSYDRLQLKEFPTPQPGKGEILIKAYACGVNFADCCVRMGVYRSANEFVGWPITPGFETAGIVAAVGMGVSKFSVGQRVVAVTFFGGYATHLVVHENYAFLIPENLSFVEAAAVPSIFLTAYYGLFELAHPRAQDIILVHSAAGGVGTALVQLGKMADCKVVGVVGAAHKAETVRNLGAWKVIDKSKQNLWKECEELAPMGFDVVFDANGAETLRNSYSHLRAGGKLVVYGFHSLFTKGRGKLNWIKAIWGYLRTPTFNPLKMTSENRSVLAYNLSYLFGLTDIFSSDIQIILNWIQEGKLVLPPIKIYPLAEAAQAHRDLESGMTVGKLVLSIDQT